MKFSIHTERYKSPSLPPKRIVEIGRWRFMFIFGRRFKVGFRRIAKGAFSAGFKFGMVTGLRRYA